MRLVRFRCEGCGLEMALPERPDKCFCCGSSSIVRIGWRQRFKEHEDEKSKESVS